MTAMATESMAEMLQRFLRKRGILSNPGQVFVDSVGRLRIDYWTIWPIDGAHNARCNAGELEEAAKVVAREHGYELRDNRWIEREAISPRT